MRFRDGLTGMRLWILVLIDFYEADTKNFSFFASCLQQMSTEITGKTKQKKKADTRSINNVINTGSLFSGPDDKKAI